MKKKYSIILFFILFAFVQQVLAQKDSTGIYKSAADYEQGKLIYGLQCNSDSENIKIDLIHLEREYYVRVEHNDVKGYHFFRLKSGDVFGYRTCDDKVYRVHKNKKYHMLNPGEEILLYAYEPPEYSLKNISPEHKYYFSVGPGTSLQQLTIKNLKAAFSGNEKFLQELDAQFKNDKEMYTYDTDHKMYKVNMILEKNKQL